ncbi:jg9598 [Pararge aegeria aegeria]|uniref:Jg9598 protein n=1 Tax=Pararge aegeria aegeria TaxID=348720 RepID=A0A8S4S8M9_9NEOP|nr:jg9598 [Pararge aegeria aegeria]
MGTDLVEPMYAGILRCWKGDLANVSSLPSPTTEEDEDEDDTTPSRADADDDGRVYKNPRNSPSAQCPRDEEQATLLGQKCLRKCSSDEDCKSKKKKCLCDGACGMSCIKPGIATGQSSESGSVIMSL